jgi:hypothetical protein
MGFSKILLLIPTYADFFFFTDAKMLFLLKRFFGNRRERPDFHAALRNGYWVVPSIRATELVHPFEGRHANQEAFHP